MEVILYSFLWWQVLAITVISAGYHRYFAHRAFKAGVWYEYYVLALGTLTGSRPLIGWAQVHREHHIHTDTEKDPHSPLFKGLWTVLTSTFDAPKPTKRTVKDLLKNKRVMWFYRYHYHIRIATLLFSLLLPIEWAFVFIYSPMIYAYLGFGLINAFAHGPNGVRNSHLLNILSGGEGFHKNHHESPRDWKIGRHWYELDPAAWFIYLIKKPQY